MMRYVVPAEDTELHITFYGGDNFAVSQSEGNVYLYIEEIDKDDPERTSTEGPEHAIFKLFDSGEPVDGTYIGTVGEGRSAKHMYWVNVMESDRYEQPRGDLRVSGDVPKVQTSGSSDAGSHP